MTFNFVIPSKNADLRESSGNNYCVSRFYNAQEIATKLKDARTAFQGKGPVSVFDHFDTFFSLLEVPVDEVPLRTAIRAHEILSDCIEKLVKELSPELDKNDLDSMWKHDLLNASKMLIYLTVSIVKVIDLATDGKGNKKGGGGDYDQHNWEPLRKKFLIQIFNFVQLKLEQLYEPPVVEESFVNLICDLSYRTLQQQVCVRDKRTTEVAFQILAVAIKRFNHSMAFPVKIIQVLGEKEFSVRPCAEGIYTIFYEQYKITSIFDVLVKELVEQLAENASDGKLAKQYSQFLMDFSSIAPSLIIGHLSEITEALMCVDNHVVRNSVLQIMADTIESELKGEDLEEDMKELRDEFLDVIFEHTYDVSAHVRAKVLGVWVTLKERNAVPLSRHHEVLERATDRLDDKSSLVRKAAVNLICSFLVYNPFSAKLSLEEIQQKYDEEEKKLEALRAKRTAILPVIERVQEEWEAMLTDLERVILNEVNTPITEPPNGLKDIGQVVADLLAAKKFKEALLMVRRCDTANAEEVATFSFEKKCEYFQYLLKSYHTIANQPPDFSDEIAKASDCAKFHHECLEFSKLITNAVPKLLEMLMSKTNSDVHEAIRFFTTTFQFGIKGCEVGMQQMIYLVWSPDKEKREVVTNAYKEVLFTTDLKDRAHSVKVVENLSRFLEHLTVGQYAAFEVLVKEWVEQEVIDHQMIQVMFERYTMKLQGTTQNDSRLALQLLVLCSVANPQIVKGNMEFLVQQIGVDERGLKDPRIYCATLDLFIKSVEKKYEHTSKYFKRFEHESDIVEKVVFAFKRFFFSNIPFDFDSLAIKTFNFIYRNCINPDVLAQVVIIDIFERMKRLSASTENGNISLNVPSFILARFIYTIGFVAMKEMIYLDIDVYSNMKFREELKHEKKTKKKASDKRRTHLHASTLDISSASTALKRMSMAQQNDPEEDLVGASAEDLIAEQINYVIESELLYSSECLLPKFHPLINEVCQSINRFKDESLQQSAVLALIHLMSVSAKFCEDNVPFLMNIFQNTKSNKVKCNIIIGLADINFRFPNVIEPWTSYLYATLHEKDPELRMTAVKMLSHLILHEMILVKGQVSDLAMCLVDAVVEIRIMTEQFFKEIGQKSNILYNVLPDIISRLSDPALQLEEGKYRVIMKYIMGLIHKDKQVETLVEKLCLRFNVTFSERQWRDISYCLTLLNHTEKTIRKLIEKIQCFKDKVQFEEVYDAFKLIITTTSKLAKPELKAVVQEFETRLEQCLSVNPEDSVPDTSTDVVSQSAPTKKPTRGGRKPPAKSNTTARNRGKKLVASSSDDSGSDFENQPPAAKTPAPTRTPAVPRSSRRAPAKVIEDSDSSDSEEIRPKAKRGRSRR